MTVGSFLSNIGKKIGGAAEYVGKKTYEGVSYVGHKIKSGIHAAAGAMSGDGKGTELDTYGEIAGATGLGLAAAGAAEAATGVGIVPAVATEAGAAILGTTAGLAKGFSGTAKFLYNITS